MAKKKPETVTISKALSSTMEGLIDKYAMLLISEIDSSVNDESVKKSLKKDLKEVEKFEVRFNKETRPLTKK